MSLTRPDTPAVLEAVAAFFASEAAVSADPGDAFRRKIATNLLRLEAWSLRTQDHQRAGWAAVVAQLGASDLADLHQRLLTLQDPLAQQQAVEALYPALLAALQLINPRWDARMDLP